MRTIAIKIKRYSGEVNALVGGREKLFLHATLGTLVFLGVLYAFFLGSMVSHIVERKALETEARVLSGEVAELELRYQELAKGIDLELSHSMGFKETRAIFAPRKTIGAVDLVNNEI